MHETPRMVVVALCTVAFAGTAWADPHEPEPVDPVYFDGSPTPTYAIDCNEKEDVGYVQGDAYTITVVTVDGGLDAQQMPSRPITPGERHG